MILSWCRTRWALLAALSLLFAACSGGGAVAPPTTVELQVWLDVPGSAAGEGVAIRGISRPRSGAPASVGHGSLLRTSETLPVTDANGRLTVNVNGGPEIGLFAQGDGLLQGEVVLEAAPGETLQAELILQTVPLPVPAESLQVQERTAMGTLPVGSRSLTLLPEGVPSLTFVDRVTVRAKGDPTQALELGGDVIGPGAVRVLLPANGIDQVAPLGPVEILLTGREFSTDAFRSYRGEFLIGRSQMVGTLRTPDGSPIPQGEIRAEILSLGDGSVPPVVTTQSVLSDSMGRFALSGLPLGTLSITHDDVAAGRFATAILPNETQTLELIARTPAEIHAGETGAVIDGQSRDLAFLTVNRGSFDFPTTSRTAIERLLVFDVQPGVDQLQLRWEVQTTTPWTRLLAGNSDTSAFGVRAYSASTLDGSVDPRTMVTMVDRAPALGGDGRSGTIGTVIDLEPLPTPASRTVVVSSLLLADGVAAPGTLTVEAYPLSSLPSRPVATGGLEPGYIRRLGNTFIRQEDSNHIYSLPSPTRSLTTRWMRLEMPGRTGTPPLVDLTLYNAEDGAQGAALLTFRTLAVLGDDGAFYVPDRPVTGQVSSPLPAESAVRWLLQESFGFTLAYSPRMLASVALPTPPVARRDVADQAWTGPTMAAWIASRAGEIRVVGDLAPPDQGPLRELRVIPRAFAPDGNATALAAHTLSLRRQLIGNLTGPPNVGERADLVRTMRSALDGWLADPTVVELVVGSGASSNRPFLQAGWFREAMRDGVVHGTSLGLEPWTPVGVRWALPRGTLGETSVVVRVRP